jgi:hypothetical protein
MSTHSTDHSSELDYEDRYEFFLSAVADSREIWILVNTDQAFLKIFSEDDQQEYVPVWPSSETAKHYAGVAGDALVPKALSVPEFYQRWVPGLSRDGVEVGVFPSSDEYVWLTSAKELKQDLEDAMSQFF